MTKDMIFEVSVFTRQQAIDAIEDTYPADTMNPLHQQIAQNFLAQAISEQRAAAWRDMPDAVLYRYAELCVNEQRRRTDNAERARSLGL